MREIVLTIAESYQFPEYHCQEGEYDHCGCNEKKNNNSKTAGVNRSIWGRCVAAIAVTTKVEHSSVKAEQSSEKGLNKEQKKAEKSP